ncbi:hypothetical protein [Nannocystis radixulma]|uniref:Uncharacterized protein n=1 Tax=Nannocystis radixulma TaxID=2995305 RepID=A0ABT5BRX0_9BACT|nr:hypothetical protein [Nannocystis radixulma]MDC0675666.1 hypothetical protein [Nannocystis radixulma]
MGPAAPDLDVFSERPRHSPHWHTRSGDDPSALAYFLADVGELPAGLADALPLFVWDTDRLRTYPAPCTMSSSLGSSASSPPPCGAAKEAPPSRSRRPKWRIGRTCILARMWALAVDLQYSIVCQHDGWRLADATIVC